MTSEATQTVAQSPDPSAAAEALLQVSRLCKSFAGRRVLDHVDLALAPGEMLSLIGPNGCGKTTLFNLIAGDLRADAGEVRLQGRRITRLPAWRAARLGIARKFQVPSVFDELSVRDNLEVCVGRRPRTGETRSGHIDALLGRVRLDSHAGRQAGTLSHGQRQWLEIAMALASRPSLLLLDEPTTGMTPNEVLETLDLLRSLNDGTGAHRTACIIVEHNLQFVEALGARVLVMLEGRVVANGRYEDIRLLPEVREAYLGRGDRLHRALHERAHAEARREAEAAWKDGAAWGNGNESGAGGVDQRGLHGA